MANDPDPDAQARTLAERAVDNGECGAQLEIKDADLRESMVRNVAKIIASALRAAAEKVQEVERKLHDERARSWDGWAWWWSAQEIVDAQAADSDKADDERDSLLTQLHAAKGLADGVRSILETGDLDDLSNADWSCARSALVAFDRARGKGV